MPEWQAAPDAPGPLGFRVNSVTVTDTLHRNELLRLIGRCQVDITFDFGPDNTLAMVITTAPCR